MARQYMLLKPESLWVEAADEADRLGVDIIIVSYGGILILIIQLMIIPTVK
jgi:hypothetical protein